MWIILPTMAELWKRILQVTHKNASPHSESSPGGHGLVAGHRPGGQSRHAPTPDDIEQQLTSFVISGHEEKALELLQSHPAPGHYDCLLRVYLQHIHQHPHLQIHASARDVSGPPRGRRRNAGPLLTLRRELLDSGPYGQDPGRLVNVCRQLLPDRFDAALAMCLQHVRHKGDNQDLCSMVAALLNAGSYHEQPQTVAWLLRHNVQDFLKFAEDGALAGGSGNLSWQHSSQHARRRLAHFHSSHQYTPRPGSSLSSALPHRSSEREVLEHPASWPYCHLLKTVLDGECLDLRQFYVSEDGSIGPLVQNVCYLLMDIRKRRRHRLQACQEESSAVDGNLLHQKNKHQSPQLEEENALQPESRGQGQGSSPLWVDREWRERALCRVLALLVRAGVTHVLDVRGCFLLPASSVYCPALRSLLDLIALVSGGVADPLGSGLGAEAALLCQVGWLPRLGPYLRTWWDAMATRLGDRELKHLAAFSWRLRSLKALTAVRVSQLVGAAPDRRARVQALKLPPDLQRFVLLETYAEAYLAVVGGPR